MLDMTVADKPGVPAFTNLLGELQTVKEIGGDNRKEKLQAVFQKYALQAPWALEAVQYALDPFVQYYVKQLPDIQTEGVYTLDEDEWEHVVKYNLNKLHRREFLAISERTEALKIIFSRYNSSDREALRRILLKDLRVGVNTRSVNMAMGYNLIPVPDTQLCKTYDPASPVKKVKTFWATPKLNGLRGRFLNRKPDGSLGGNTYHLLTREDMVLIGFVEMQDELLYLATNYGLDMIDGEIYSPVLPFQTIMSIARGEKNYDPSSKAMLKMYIFNALQHTQDGKWANTGQMVKGLRGIFKEAKQSGHKFKYIELLPYQAVENTPEAIHAACIRYMLQGFEGIVLRDPVVFWEAGKRNNHLLKYKLFAETDLVVLSVGMGTAGKKWEDKVASLLCKGTVTGVWKEFNGRRSFVPLSGYTEDYTDFIQDGNLEVVELPVMVEASLSSLSDKERDEMTANIDDVVGRIAEVKFQAVTDKPNSDGYYSLQFPVFAKFKS